MMPLTNTEYYQKSKLWHDKEKKVYWSISPFSNGNCGLNAFACGLIDLIIRDKVSLDKEKFNDLKKTILESLTKNFKAVHRQIDLFFTNHLSAKIFYKPNLTFDFFKEFLKIQDREGLASLNLVLAQGLRIIGVKHYLSLINKQDNTLLKEDSRILKNGEWIGEEILSSLANYFDIPVRLIYGRSTNNQNTNPTQYYYHLPKKYPAFSLLNQNFHWHYLLPKNQADGLARMLPHREKPQALLKNEQLLQRIEKSIKITSIFNKSTLNSLSENLKQIFYHLKIVFSMVPISVGAMDTAFGQANKAATKSTEAINKLRQTWIDDIKELDKRLDKLGLRKIEKDLIKRPIITDNSKDAAMAAILQNAEIADFFSRNHNTLVSFTNVSSTTPNPLRSDQHHAKPSLVCY